MSQLDKLHKIRPIKNIDIQTAEDGSVVLWLSPSRMVAHLAPAMVPPSPMHCNGLNSLP